MIDLVRLSPQQLWAVKKQLDNFFYTSGTNVALLNALQKPTTKSFQIQVERALILQIFHLAQLDKIYQLLQAVTKQDEAIVDQVQNAWLPFDQSLIQGKTTLLAFLLFGASEGGQAALDKMVPQLKFILTDRVLKQQLQKRVDFIIRVLDQTGIAYLADKIKVGLEHHLTVTQIVKNLRQEAQKYAIQRAGLITETELMVGMNLAELETYRRNGIVKVRWMTQLDERTCEVCLANEAAGYIPIDSEFPMGTDSPPAHANCRCYLLPQLPTVITGEVWTGGSQ